MTLNFIVNGKPVTLETEPDRRLLDILREDLHLTGTKEVIVRAYRKGLGVVPTFKTVDT